MRRIVSGVGIVGTLLAASLASAQSPAPRAVAAERAIRPLLAEQMQAANAHDTDRFLAHYARDSALVLVFNTDVIRGYAAIRAQQLRWWNNGKSDVAYSEREPALFTVVTPDVVVVTQQLQSRRTLPSGATASGDFVASSVWQHAAGGWRIVAAHESTAH